MIIEATHLINALFDVNFSIEKGAVVGSLVPNGAGRSTTINLLCG